MMTMVVVPVLLKAVKEMMLTDPMIITDFTVIINIYFALSFAQELFINMQKDYV